MSNETIRKFTASDLDKLFSEHGDLIMKNTPMYDCIPSDDEWNDPIYDHYAKDEQEDLGAIQGNVSLLINKGDS